MSHRRTAMAAPMKWSEETPGMIRASTPPPDTPDQINDQWDRFPVAGPDRTRDHREQAQIIVTFSARLNDRDKVVAEYAVFRKARAYVTGAAGA